MTAAQKRIVGKASGTTAVAVVAALAVFIIARWITGGTIDERDWLETIFIPIIVGMPIACYVFAQAEKLRSAYVELAELNAVTERAHQQLKEAHEIIAFAARYDKMTGLLNREHFLDAVRAAHQAGERDVLLIIDADHFKRINDRYGHMKGDEALITIANAIRQAVRLQDEVGRLGGEEFGVLLKNVFPSIAVDLAENIRRQVSESLFSGSPGGVPVALTVSIGGAALADFPQGLTEVLVQADGRLYRAKRAGRNRVEFDTTLVQLVQSMARQDERKQQSSKN